MSQPNFEQSPEGLIPAIIQDSQTKNVLMLGYFSKESWEKTQQLGQVTFFSRSKQRLWTKGEESGHYLEFISAKLDCDTDAFLVQARPKGPTCHKGTDSCWGEENKSSFGFLSILEKTIAERKESANEKSYVADLFTKGINKIAQKVGEEAVETVIEAKDHNDELFLNESADLLFHYLILLQAKGYRLEDVVKVLEERKK